MNFQQLETFLHIARLGSLSKAATRLNATQSTVSMRLSELERELGVELVDRRYRPCRLTGKGRELIPYAENVVTLTGEIRHSIGNPAQLSGSVRIGVGEHVALTWLPKLVAALNNLHPDVVVELDIGLLESMTGQLRAGELDILLSAALDTEEPGLTYQPLGTEQFVWMVSPTLILQTKAMTPNDLALWPIMTMSAPSVLHRLMRSWFDSGGATPKQVNVCNSLNVCAGLTRAGLGIGLLPKPYAQALDAKESLIELKITPALAPTPFYAIHAAKSAPPLAGVIADLATTASTFQ